jgi:cytochrome c oxidase subunit 2
MATRFSAFSIAILCVCALTSCDYAVEYSGELVGNRRTIEVHVRRFAYEPGIITVQRGDTVVIKLVSDDVAHGFYLFDYGLNAYVDPGETRIIGFVADKPGRFSFRCSRTCG